MTRATLPASKPRFFATPAAFRAWFEKHHHRGGELWVGFYKRGSGKPSITWPEAVDQALCFGWIDGVRKSIDESSYVIRFTPRKPHSTWSAINIRRAKQLDGEGLMYPAGREAFARRRDDKSAIYAYEQRTEAKLAPAQQKRLRENTEAWRFFQAQPPWYRRTATYWVVSAKKAETRERRLATLIEDCAAGRRIKHLTPPAKRSQPS